MARVKNDELEEAINILKKGKSVIKDKSSWAQHSAALDVNDHTVLCSSPYAIKWCATGIIRRIAGISETWMFETDNATKFFKPYHLLSIASIHMYDIVPEDVNDLLGHEAVMAMYDTAIQRASHALRTGNDL